MKEDLYSLLTIYEKQLEDIKYFKTSQQRKILGIPITYKILTKIMIIILSASIGYIMELI